MAKFYGVIGYAIQSETSPGIWTEVITERIYRGDILQNRNRWQASDNVNDNLLVSNKISIISDSFSYENLQYIRYVNWMGANWKVDSIEIQRPRLLISIGGVYNGPTTRSA